MNAGAALVMLGRIEDAIEAHLLAVKLLRAENRLLYPSPSLNLLATASTRCARLLRENGRFHAPNIACSAFNMLQSGGGGGAA